MAEIEETLAEMSQRAQEYRDALLTEEATKTAIVMPFIARVLGYDIFNPAEVLPEFVADVGLKRGEKIDYAIVRDDRVNLLIEAKRAGEELSLAHASQLVRYFHTSEARVAILTNGLTWHFYTDLDRPNIMDERPFLVLDLLDVDPATLPHLRMMAKESFDLDTVIATAEELKYVSAIKREIATELNQPGDDFVRLFAKRVHKGNLNARAMEQFTDLTARAAKQYINDRVNARLKNALADQGPMIGAALEDGPTHRVGSPSSGAGDEAPAAEKPGIITTDEELEAFRIIRAIVSAVVPARRIFMRDAHSYCAIILDDNNRKTIARLYFGKVRRIAVFDAEKNETRVVIKELEDIYEHSDTLRAVVSRYVGEESAD